MENYQEKILEKYNSPEAIKDCFYISRIESELGALSKTAPFNQSSRDKMTEKYDELDAILIKYPYAVKLTTEE